LSIFLLLQLNHNNLQTPWTSPWGQKQIRFKVRFVETLREFRKPKLDSESDQKAASLPQRLQASPGAGARQASAAIGPRSQWQRPSSANFEASSSDPKFNELVDGFPAGNRKSKVRQQFEHYLQVPESEFSASTAATGLVALCRTLSVRNIDIVAVTSAGPRHAG